VDCVRYKRSVGPIADVLVISGSPGIVEVTLLGSGAFLLDFKGCSFLATYRWLFSLSIYEVFLNVLKNVSFVPSLDPKTRSSNPYTNNKSEGDTHTN